MRCVLIALFVACSAEAATYRGIERSDAWVDRAYLHFRTRVASVEARWVDVSMPERFVTSLPPLSVARVNCRVERVLPDGLLVRVAAHDRHRLATARERHSPNARPTKFTASGQRLLLDGVSAPATGSVLALAVVAIGKTKLGTTPVYRCVEPPKKHEPLTREQFLALLASGFRLYEWRWTHKAVGTSSIIAYTQRLVP